MLPITLYQKLKTDVFEWRNARYPSEFPLIKTILEHNQNGFLRKAQFEASSDDNLRCAGCMCQARQFDAGTPNSANPSQSCAIAPLVDDLADTALL